MANGKKPYSLYRRGKIYYARFRMPDNTWSTAKSSGETAKGRAESWAINYIRSGQIVVKENVTFAEYSKDFFSFNGRWATDRKATGKRIGPRHCEERDLILRKHLIPTFGNRKLTDISRGMIKDFRNDLFQREYSGNTINKTLSALKTILEWAEEDSLIQFVPKIDRAASNPQHRGIMTVDEVKALFQVQWDDFRAYCINLLAASSGLRMGELLALTMEDIHLDDQYINVSRSWDRRTGTMNETTKTGRSRTVFIPQFVVSELERLIDINPHNPKSFLFFSRKLSNRPMSENLPFDQLIKSMRKIGIDDRQRQDRNITFHSWRHWFNSLLINAKIPLQKIQALTGHLTSEMTQHYYHGDDMDDVKQIVGSIFGGD